MLFESSTISSCYLWKLSYASRSRDKDDVHFFGCHPFGNPLFVFRVVCVPSSRNGVQLQQWQFGCLAKAQKSASEQASQIKQALSRPI